MVLTGLENAASLLEKLESDRSIPMDCGDRLSSIYDTLEYLLKAQLLRERQQSMSPPNQPA